ncbi:hypothetical protein HY989_06530 [Candidatus Micrarchaeota archaeon]|nr:hypothetical protein [Candidatus Micrarchaeota archaeon]
MGEFGNVINRNIDVLGRIVLPAKWRRGYSNAVTLIRKEDGRIEIMQKKPGAFMKHMGTVKLNREDLEDIDGVLAKAVEDELWSQ